MNNLKLYEFNFSLHVELELEVSTLDKFNYHQCQFLTLNSQSENVIMREEGGNLLLRAFYIQTVL